MAPARAAHRPTVADTPESIVGDDQVQELLTVLEDPDCRAILQATSECARSASELSEECALPLSTTYRKLETLDELGLLEEDIRIRQSGKHTSEYTRRLEEVRVTMTPEEDFGVYVSHREPETAQSAF